MNTPDLLMIVPTRGRPHAIPGLWQAWQATSSGHADLFLAVDDDDPALDNYLEAVEPMLGHGTQIGVGPRLRMVGTLNAVAVAYASRYPLLGFMGDDHRPRSAGWDARLVECLSAGTGIAYGDDLLQHNRMPTAVAMTSDIITTLGYMAPPAMTHLCVDLVWKDWGEQLGRITYLPHVVIEHLHPANGKAPLDAGYEDANSAERVQHDTAAYHAYMADRLHDDITKLKGLL